MVVKRITNLFNREFSSLNQAAILLGFFTFLSQILGLVRDRLFAETIGPSRTLDIYYASFKVPDFLFVSVASLASVTVLLPFLVEKLKDKVESEQARKFLSNVFSAFILILIVSTVILFIFLPAIAGHLVPGFDAPELHSMVYMSRIMLLSPLFLGISNLFGSVTQMFRRFFVFALSPVFYNLGIILGIVLFYPMMGNAGLAIGVVFGAVMHLSVQLPVIIKHRFLPRFRFKIDWHNIKDIVKISLPRTLGLALSSIELIVYVALASTIDKGSISIFQFSLNLQNVPLGLIGASYSVAAFPLLVNFFSKKDLEGFVGQVTSAMRQLIFWSLPFMFLFIVLRAQVVRVIFGSHNFTWADTRLTAALFALFIISLLSQNIILLITRAYYAAGNTKKPLLINFFCTILTIILLFVFKSIFEHHIFFRYFLESILRVENLTSTSILMLPLAFSIGNIINGQILWWLFIRDFKKPKSLSTTKSFFQIFAGAFFAGYIAYGSLTILSGFLNTDTFFGILGQGIIAGLAGAVAGFVVLKILNNQELEAIINSLRSKKILKAETLSPGQQEM
jgi:putative peptidoglycan lipid II flippase